MRVWTCKGHWGFGPGQACAVVVAPTRAEGARLLNDRLSDCGLPRAVTPDDLFAFYTAKPHAYVIGDGSIPQ